ncbi:DUF4097 family beta strand repeat protein [candidate division KSB1 bacterium]|nr:DUF4097 family beta strand repeat protein [candidate division KSB1 bacterium]
MFRTRFWRKASQCLWLSFVLLLPLAGFAQEERSEKFFDVKPGGWLDLRADFGAVEVQSWPKDEMKIEVTKWVEGRHRRSAKELFEDYEISYSQTARGVSIIAEMRGMSSWRRSNDGLQVEFRITVPQRYNLDLNTSGGSIGVDDLIGEARVKTSGGSLTLGRIEGPVNAKTSGGGIELRRCKGDLLAHTSGGGIDVGDVDGEVDVETSGGSISVNGASGNLRAHTSGGGLSLSNLRGNVDASTSGGSIEAELLAPISAPCELSTSGGGILVYVSKDFKADLDARCSGGDVHCDMPITVQGAIGEGKLAGKINGGGPLLTLRTSGGGIELRQR